MLVTSQTGTAIDDEFDKLAGLAGSTLNAPFVFITIDTKGHRQVVGRSSPTNLTGHDADSGTMAAEADLLEIDDITNGRGAAARSGPVALVENGDGRVVACATIHDGKRVAGTLQVLGLDEMPAEPEGLRRQLTDIAAIAGTLIQSRDARRHRQVDERTRRRDEFRHSLAIEAANLASWIWEPQSDLITCDNTLFDLLDIEERSELTLGGMLEAVNEQDRERVRTALQAAMAEDTDFHLEFRDRTGERWLLGLGRVAERGPYDEPVSIVAVNIDITETKQAERTTRALLRELNHRVKNTLAMLQSMAAQTLRRSDSAEAFMVAFSGRLQAISAAHNLLSDNEWRNVSIKTLLRTLISPYARDMDDNVEITGEDLGIGPDEGLSLGLVIHEMVTNAARHGALSQPTGMVHIDLRAERDGEARTLRLDWMESGGPEVERPEHRGFGSILIERGLQRIIGSEVQLEYMPEGVRARIALPLEDEEAPPS